MDPFWIALAFVIVGIILLLAEAAAPGSFIMVPGTVIIALGLIWMLYPSWTLQWWSILIALAILIPMIFVAIKLYQKLAPPAPPETTVATSLVGKTGVVLKEVEPNDLSGKVRIEGQTWSAMAANRIPVGTAIVVSESRGVHVVVKELQKQ